MIESPACRYCGSIVSTIARCIACGRIDRDMALRLIQSSPLSPTAKAILVVDLDATIEHEARQ